jgi:hypothetical protein
MKWKKLNEKIQYRIFSKTFEKAAKKLKVNVPSLP